MYETVSATVSKMVACVEVYDAEADVEAFLASHGSPGAPEPVPFSQFKEVRKAKRRFGLKSGNKRMADGKSRAGRRGGDCLLLICIVFFGWGGGNVNTAYARIPTHHALVLRFYATPP